MTSTNIIAKVAASAAGFALVAMSFASALPAVAQTTTLSASQIAALEAQIASLQAQLSAATGGSSSASVTFTRDLTVGSTGSDVTALQTWLIAKGYSIPAGATGYFGSETKAAVAAYQAANGISPAVGYFGPITRAKVNASGGSTTGTTTTTGSTTLSGGEGSVDNFETIGASNTSFNAGDTEQVLGFSFKADGSDLEVNRVNFDVVLNTQSNSNGSPRPWNFFETATLMDGNTTIGTVDASNQNNWSEDGTVTTGGNSYQQYRIQFPGLNDVVKEGTTADYYLSFTTQSAISDSNAGGTYTVTLPNQGLRATDALGIQQYTDSTADATFSITNDQNGSAVLSQASDNPQTSSVQGDTSSVTNGITTNAFTIQAKSSNLELYSIPVTLTTSLATSSIEVRDLKLYQGSTLLDTESVPAGSGTGSGTGISPVTITFQNLNFQIPEGTTDEFNVQADINKIDGTTFTNGATAVVSVPGTNVDIENSSGNTVSITGASTGNTLTFYSTGISVDSTPTTSATASANGQTTQQIGNFTFTFNVTAFGEDIYLSSTTNGYTPLTVYAQNGTSTTTAATSITSTADRSTDNNYVIHNGQTKQVTISFTKYGQSGYAFAKLSTLLFGIADAAPLSNSFNFPSSYQTTQVYLSD